MQRPVLLLLFLFSLLCSLSAADTAMDPPSPDPLAPLNEHLPAWLRVHGVYRARLEAADGIGLAPVDDDYFLSRLRLNVAIQPKPWLQFFAETQDARVFFNHHVGNVPPYQNMWDIRQGYVRLGSAKEGWADFLFGREELKFGDERLVGPSNWSNQGRTFDVARLSLHHPGYLVTIFSSSVVIARDGVVDHHFQGNNLHGVYAGIQNVIPRGRLEPFFLWRTTPANLKLNTYLKRTPVNEATFGARWFGQLPAHFDYDMTMAKQTGSVGSQSIGAWAGHWNVGRAFSTTASPRVFVEANYATGTKNPTGHTWGTFDPVYASGHDKLDFADLVGWRNVEQVRAGAEEAPGKKWKLRQTYEDIWLASARDALYGSNTYPVAVSPTGAAGRHVGQEVDLLADYQWSAAFKFGLGYCHFFTGQFLNRTTHGKDYNYPYVSLEYAF